MGIMAVVAETTELTHPGELLPASGSAEKVYAPPTAETKDSWPEVLQKLTDSPSLNVADLGAYDARHPETGALVSAVVSSVLRRSGDQPLRRDGDLRVLSYFGGSPWSFHGLAQLLRMKPQNHMAVAQVLRESPRSDFAFIESTDDLWSHSSRLTCSDAHLASLIVQLYVESDHPLLMQHQALWTLSRGAPQFVARCLRENDSFLLQRLMPRALGISVDNYINHVGHDQHIINRIRNDAEHLGGARETSPAALDPRFWKIRKSVHYSFSQRLIPEIEAYLNNAKQEYAAPYDYESLDKEWGKVFLFAPDEFRASPTIQDQYPFIGDRIALARIFLAERLVRDLKLLFQETRIETLLESLPENIIPEQSLFLKNFKNNLIPTEKLSLLLDLGKSLRDQLKLATQEPLESSDTYAYGDALGSITDKPSAVRQQIKERALMAAINSVGTSQFLILQNALDRDNQIQHNFKFLQQVLRALWFEGLLSGNELKETSKTLTRLEREASQDKNRLRHFLQYVFGLGESRIRNYFETASNLWGQFDPLAYSMIENLIRTTSLLRLSAIIERLRSEGLSFEALSVGEAEGRLYYVETAHDYATLHSSAADILVFGPDIQVVGKHPFAAIISESPLVEGSHTVTLARQGLSPKPVAFAPAYMRQHHDEIKKLNGQWVKVVIDAEGVSLEKPAKVVQQARQKIVLNVNTSFHYEGPILDLKDKAMVTILKGDNEIGGKALHFAEIYQLLGEEHVFPGMAIPFSVYQKFIHTAVGDDKTLTLADRIQWLVQHYDAWSKEERAIALEDLRYRFNSQTIDPTVIHQISEILVGAYGAKVKIRFRSSSNLEDRADFNAAGLHDSFAAFSDDLEGITMAIRQVFASAWNDRAFEARRVVDVDQTKIMMGVLVHPSHRQESANGVIYSAISPKNSATMRIIVQEGKDSVTNPETQAQPEILDVEREEVRGRVIARRRSTMTAGFSVLTTSEIEMIRQLTQKVHEYFGYAVDIEFKRTPNGTIMFKQARPYRVTEVASP